MEIMASICIFSWLLGLAVSYARLAVNHAGSKLISNLNLVVIVTDKHIRSELYKIWL